MGQGSAAILLRSQIDCALPGLEIATVVVKVESRGIVTETDAQRFIALLERLNIVTDQATAAHALGDTFHPARRFKLSAYATAYLELALRTGPPLATLDADLTQAASTAGGAICGAH